MGDCIQKDCHFPYETVYIVFSGNTVEAQKKTFHGTPTVDLDASLCTYVLTSVIRRTN
jgi:hypothetical protein